MKKLLFILTFFVFIFGNVFGQFISENRCKMKELLAYDTRFINRIDWQNNLYKTKANENEFLTTYWDNDKLTQIFNEMSFEGFDITLTGFEDFEINNSLGFFDDNFDDSDIEDGGADENFDNSFSEVETYTQEGTFENHEGDIFDFGDFELKIKNN